MPRLLRACGIVEDRHPVLPKDFSGPPPHPALVPLQYWLANRERLRELPETGVWLDSDDEPAALAPDIDVLTCIGINFPTFMDGRGFSTARLLRERYRFGGELRALGQIIPDQLFFLKRCGFDSFHVADELSPDRLQTYLAAFSVTYQTGVDEPLPLFRRRTS